MTNGAINNSPYTAKELENELQEIKLDMEYLHILFCGSYILMFLVGYQFDKLFGNI